LHPIARYRRALGLTQSQLAKELGVAMQSVQTWEKGTQPHPRNLKRLAEVLGVDTLKLSDEIDAANAEDGKPAVAQ
jgi:transcriptional regulator with XRE-family HTH domain